MYAIAIFLTYNLQFYVPYTLLWPRICRRILYRYDDRIKANVEHVFRIGLIMITCKLNDKNRVSSLSRERERLTLQSRACWAGSDGVRV
jgi:hypothetical protein